MQKVIIILPEKIGLINRNIYGHFTEHIGGVFYDGIWVGEDARVPNIHGFRKDLIERLKRINPPIIRWPGGCFAETYNWRDGIGARKKRPKTASFWYGLDGKVESNAVGTHEFTDFCKLVGAEPYFAANITSLTPLEIRNWVEYCNYPQGSTLLTELRSKNGSPSPFGVKYWGIGNENWGGGGNMTPEDYCFEFRKYSNIIDMFGGKHLKLIACGPAHNDIEWTRRFFRKLYDISHPVNFPVYGYSIHYYCGTAGNALEFDDTQWYELLGKAAMIENIIMQQRALMDSFDPDRKIGIIVDEWGCWHPSGSGPTKGGYLFEQQSTMRDALAAAITLDIFNNHCDKVVMANIAQLINCLHSLFLAVGDQFVTTPNYHVFDLYKEHQDGIAVRLLSDAGKIEYGQQNAKDMSLNRLSCSASVKERKLTITLSNCHYSEECEIKLDLLGGRFAGSCIKKTLTAPDPHACNSFTEPNKVVPIIEEMMMSGSESLLVLPPASVVSITADLLL